MGESAANAAHTRGAGVCPRRVGRVGHKHTVADIRVREHGVLDGDRLPGATSGGVNVYPCRQGECARPAVDVEFGSTVSVPTAVKSTLPSPLACDVSRPSTTMKPAFDRDVVQPTGCIG